jgi:protein-S-isoprenylcysteine O-methyltransferase Ste14
MSILQTPQKTTRFMASEFEFRYRFWIIASIYWIAFSFYAIDHRNSGHMLARSVAHLRGATSSTLDHHLVFGVAALLACLASLLRSWATAYLKPEVMAGMRLQTSRLVADGPYRFVRNPLYLGNILLAVGIGAMANYAGFALLVVGNTVFVWRLMLREEAELEARQGQSFRAYCAAVPRLVPSLRPCVPSAGGLPNYASGLLGELFCWAFTGPLILFAITLNQRIYAWSLGVAFVVFAFSMFANKKRAKFAGLDS